MGKWWENDGILIWAAVKSRLPVEQDLSSWSTIIYLSACLFIHHLPTHGYYAWWRWECTYMFLFCAIMTVTTITDIIHGQGVGCAVWIPQNGLEFLWQLAPYLEPLVVAIHGGSQLLELEMAHGVIAPVIWGAHLFLKHLRHTRKRG